MQFERSLQPHFETCPIRFDEIWPGAFCGSRSYVSGAAVVGKAKPQLWQSGEKRFAHSLGALARLRRDAILEAIAVSAKELLRSSDLGASLPKVVEQVGQAAGVDRLHILEIDAARGSERGFVARHYIWSAPGILTPPEFRAVGRSMAEIGLSSWIAKYARGETVAGHSRDFAPDARAFMERGGIKSVLGIPIFVDDRWWGIVGFDDCRNEREWLPAEIDIIKIFCRAGQHRGRFPAPASRAGRRQSHRREQPDFRL